MGSCPKALKVKKSLIIEKRPQCWEISISMGLHMPGAEYLVIEDDTQIDQIISTALKSAKSNKTVLVDVHIDYKKRTRFTKGVVKTILGNFPLKDKVRFIGRAMKRKILG